MRGYRQQKNRRICDRRQRPEVKPEMPAPHMYYQQETTMKYIAPLLIAALVLLASSCDADTVGSSDFTVSPSTLDFGTVTLNTSVRKSIEITNTSGLDLYVASSLSGVDAGAFTIVYQPTQLVDGERDSVVISFMPTQSKAYVATLKVGMNNITTIPLMGEGAE